MLPLLHTIKDVLLWPIPRARGSLQRGVAFSEVPQIRGLTNLLRN
jgi:hypothetical protein